MFHTTSIKYNTSNIDKLFNDIEKFWIGGEELVSKFKTEEVSYNTYPPYNYIKEDAENLRLEFALAGYDKSDIKVITEDKMLSIESKKSDEPDTDEYLHKGLAKRAFFWKRQLADNLEVNEVDFNNGLLTIRLKKIIPETHKKKVYEIL
jgi:molecular chaperone IbpA